MVYIAGMCEHGTYFGPLGKCEDCGKLCDRPSHYPDSCKIHCPDYIPKNRLSTSTNPSTSENVKPLNIAGFSGLGAILLLTFILTLLWKKVFRRRYYHAVEERRREKLMIQTRTPVQVEADETGRENVPLNNIFEDTDSVDSGETMPSLDNIERMRILAPERIDSAQTVITISDDISNGLRSEDFDLGQTFPFHSLSSLESVLENNYDQTRRKTP